MTIDQFIEAVTRGETTEQYFKRQNKLRKYVLERDFLKDAIAILTEEKDKEQRNKKIARLKKVEKQIELLK